MTLQKYWKLIVLTIITVFTLAVLYINQTTLSSHLLQFSIKKISGDNKEVESLVLTGDVSDGLYNFESFRLDNNGTSYSRDQPFFKRLSDDYQPLEITRLQQNYRNFMRGKDENIYSYYEDKQVLAYGAIQYDFTGMYDFKFEVAVLDKKTNETVSFNYMIPNRADYAYVEVAGIEMVDENLKMITINDRDDDDLSTEVHVYTFDLKKKKIVDDEVIGKQHLLAQMDIEQEGFIQLLHGEFSDREHIIVSDIVTETERIDSVTENEELYDEEFDYKEHVKDQKIIKYNLNTKTTDKIDLPKEVVKKGIPIVFDGRVLTFINTDKELQLINYDTVKKRIEKEITINMDQSDTYLGDLFHSLNRPRVKDGKLYYVDSDVNSNLKNGAKNIVVIDLKTLDTLYEGTIEMDKPPRLENLDDLYLDFYQVEFK